MMQTIEERLERAKLNMVHVNAMDYWWKRAKAAEELLGKVKYEAHQDHPAEQGLSLAMIQELLKDVEVVKPKKPAR